MLGAVLRYLYTQVTGIDHLLAHSLDLIAQDYGNRPLKTGREVLQRHAVMHLLDAAYGVTLVLELLHRVER